jgi:hypothetical protein
MLASQLATVQASECKAVNCAAAASSASGAYSTVSLEVLRVGSIVCTCEHLDAVAARSSCATYVEVVVLIY